MFQSIDIINVTLFSIKKKDPTQRPECEQLLQWPFINGDLDSKPIKDLLLEYKAEVVEEEVVDEEAEVWILFLLIS